MKRTRHSPRPQGVSSDSEIARDTDLTPKPLPSPLTLGLLTQATPSSKEERGGSSILIEGLQC